MTALQDLHIATTTLRRFAEEHVLAAWAKNIRELWTQDRPQRQEKQERTERATVSSEQVESLRTEKRKNEVIRRGRKRMFNHSEKELVVDLFKRCKFPQARGVTDEARELQPRARRRHMPARRSVRWPRRPKILGSVHFSWN